MILRESVNHHLNIFIDIGIKGKLWKNSRHQVPPR